MPGGKHRVSLCNVKQSLWGQTNKQRNLPSVDYQVSESVEDEDEQVEYERDLEHFLDWNMELEYETRTGI